MMTSSRPRGGDVGSSFASRRGHGSQLSISDPSHHVTEAIGTLYGDSDDEAPPDNRRESRPLSFIASPYGGEQIPKPRQVQTAPVDERLKLGRSKSDHTGLSLSTQHPGAQAHMNGNPGLKKTQTMPARAPSLRTGSFDGPLSPLGGPMSPGSPTLSLRDVQADSSNPQFPMTNIDNPKDIAQELSNLQALRRMSMDVGNSLNHDPDLMPFQGMSMTAMPSIAPTGEDDEGDVSRLLWVPAQVHPELAPDQFKNFLEKRVQSIKRRSGDSVLSVDSLDGGNTGSLRRKKSMLSKQIDSSEKSADAYVDGAERLDRKRSSSQYGTPELSLNDLVKDPTKVVQQLAQDTQRQDAGPENMKDDMPILQMAPGMGLRRSTRTTYRKGGSLSRPADRIPFSKRLAARQAEKDGEERLSSSTSSDLEPPPGHGLQRVQTEPITTENFSRPTRSVRRQHAFQHDSGATATAGDIHTTDNTLPSQVTQQLPIRSSAPEQPSSKPSTPIIVETPPVEESSQFQADHPGHPSRPFPQRSSSQKSSAQSSDQRQQTSGFDDEPRPRSGQRPSLGKHLHSQSLESNPAMDQVPGSSQHSMSDITQRPSPIPGSGSTRIDNLTLIPTFAPEEKKTDRKSKDEKEGESSKLGGWKWFKSEDKDKKKKDKEKEEPSKKSRTKALVQKASFEKPAEKGHDNARLDVLQSSIDSTAPKGRESLLLDRDSVDQKLQVERKKESARKPSDSKKEKDGFFGSLFGSSKKKENKDSHGSKGKQRAASVETAIRQLRPDVDYAWTRFPIVEERAIYRMAHIKLANPRRDLRSQVLLSNFMYSYLAKVQAMHPQLNVPVSPQQKRQEEERKRREQEQQYVMEQPMQEGDDQDSIDQYNFEYHRSSNQYDDGQHQNVGGGEYVDDAQIYEYEHGGQEGDSRQQEGGYSDVGQPHQGRNYYEYEQQDDGRDGRDGRTGRRDDNDMW